ncbi:DUF3303 domain-containing protein [Singulisphaera sp. PoT]|uniref:DUF3303 domain-containing protein n=1 Tax=Singulisphaera sp. PoT TaxID=3411797 RepID=UPI003BF5179C
MLGGGKDLGRQRPGHVIRARTINRPNEQIERLTRRTVGPGLAGGTAAGVPFEYATTRLGFHAKLTGGGRYGKYDWQAVYMDKDDPTQYLDIEGWSGTADADPAIEQNFGDKLPTDGTTVVWLERDYYSGFLIFQTDNCG